MVKKTANRDKPSIQSGNLRIGDNWNAITIIALSQNNPLKAIAEFVENSIDAKANNITIIRGKERGENILKIIDDGEGIPQDDMGIPNFKYVATHICDSIKRRLKKEGWAGLQGEFGIGLLSFWTVGEQLKLISSGRDNKTYTMHMEKGQPGYTITQRKLLVPQTGTELIINPVLPGLRQISGEKIQRYLASELRDRIRKTKVSVKVIDRLARKEYCVEPRQFSGQLLHKLNPPQIPEGEIYFEIYMGKPGPENQVGLYRSGTRVLDSLARLDRFAQEPWTSGYFSGIIDVPFLNLTPGTRGGIIHDEALTALGDALQPVEDQLQVIIREQRQAEEEHASRQVLRTVQNALKEALLLLPREEYDWFEVHQGKSVSRPDNAADEQHDSGNEGAALAPSAALGQKQFFEYSGPLYKVAISPASSVVPVKDSRNYRAVARDKQNKIVEKNLQFKWQIIEGQGNIESADREITVFTAPAEPGLVRLQLTVTQGETCCKAGSIITVTGELFEKPVSRSSLQKGIPAYTFKFAPGELWRSRYDKANNLIIINSGHKDFIFAAQNKARKLRYTCRLFTKELVFENFPGLSPEQLLERMIELSLYTEENL